VHPSSQSHYAGAIKGEFNVEASGSAAYAIDIQVPPGTAGMQPALSLAYSSVLTGGMMGAGWSLRGLSAILRAGSNPAQDGRHKDCVHYDQRDRFVLDGARLVAVAGIYGAADSVYHTEMETWRRIVAKPGTGVDGPAGFLSRTKEGVSYEYGGTPDAQFRTSGDGSPIRAWGLSRVTDGNGNFMSVSYRRDPVTSAAYPARIAYTGNNKPDAALTPRRAVEFIYEARPDLQPRFESGCAVYETLRLKQVRTTLDDKTVFTYTLGYELGAASGRSRLCQVTLADGNGRAMPPTRFDWLDMPMLELAAPKKLVNPRAMPGGELIPLDVDGSGRRDLLSVHGDDDGRLVLNLMIAAGGGSYLAPVQQTLDLRYHPGCLLALDCNGDGATELLHIASDADGRLCGTLLRARRQAAGWRFESGPTGKAFPSTLPHGGQLIALDLNGDGKVDLAYGWGNDDGRLQLQALLSTGEGFALGRQTSTDLVYGYATRLIPVDFNGDGMGDLLYAFNEERDGEDLLGLRVLLSDGQGFALQPGTVLPAAARLPFGGALMAARLKDDEQDDLIYATGDDDGRLCLHSLYGTGTGYQLTAPAPLRTGLAFTGWVFPMALRGAGLLELAVAGEDAAGKLDLRLLRWQGTGFSAATPAAAALRGLAGGGLCIPADVSGHGKTDLLYFPAGDDGTLDMLLCTAPPVVPDRLCRITDGLGARIEIGYKPLTDPSLYSKDDTALPGTLDGQGLLNPALGGAAWAMTPGRSLAAGTCASAYALQSRQFAEYVVAGYTESDGRGHDYSYSYRYRGCRIDTAGRGWLGFSAREIHIAERGVTITEQYNQIFPATFTLAARTAQRDADGAIIQRSQTLYTLTGKATGPAGPFLSWQAAQGWASVYRCDILQVQAERFTMGKAAPDVIETQSYRYDPFGNVICTANVTSHGAAHYTLCSYANDESGWRLGQLQQRIEAADEAGTQILSRETYGYDPLSGLQIESGQWDDVHNHYLVTKCRHDAWGNEIALTDPSGATTLTEYDTGFRSFPIRQVMPETVPGLTLSTATAYDAAFGTEISRTDANGVVTSHRLDGLGRTIESFGPDAQGQSVAITQSFWGVDEHGFYAERRVLADWHAGQWQSERCYFDGLGRQYRRETSGVITERLADRADQTLRQSLPRRVGESTLWVTTQYDAAGRVIRTEEPADGGSSQIVETEYPTVDTSITIIMPGSPEARQSSCVYATYGNERVVTATVDAEGGRSSYVYDAAGRIVQATDPAGVTTISRYDSLGRRIAMRVTVADKIFAAETVSHDDKARSTKVTSAAGNIVTLEHDARQRLRCRQVVSASGEVNETIYHYDHDEKFARDRLVRVTMPGGAAHDYSYDANGNVNEQRVSIGRDSYSTKLAYLPTGALAQSTAPDGSVAVHRFNAAGQLVSVRLTQDGTEQEIASFSAFTAFGRPGEIAYGNGLREVRRYNARGQITAQSLGKPEQPPLAHTSFTWNRLHGLSRITDHVNPAGNQAFGYDRAGRLTQVVRNAAADPAQRVAQSFAYDAGGNLTSKNGTIFAYEGHQLVRGVRDGAEIFAARYDSDGLMLGAKRAGKADEYRYDGLGRLAAAQAARFRYDHTGQRMVKESQTATTHYVSREYEVTYFPDGAKQSTRYIHGPEGIIAQVTRILQPAAPGAAGAEAALTSRDPQTGLLAGVPEPGIGYFHTNLINSTSVHTDATGAVAAHIEYEPFGEIRAMTGRDNFRPKFTGKELDRETGLYYFNARYYDPAIGRFTSADDRPGGEFGTPDFLNRYAYVLNNPIGGIDIDGHFRWDIVLDVVIGVAAVTAIAASMVVTGGMAGPLLALAGSTLMGAAVSGTMFSAQTPVDKDVNMRDWGIEVGIGAATGLISGIPSAGAMALGNVAFRSIGGALVAAGREAATRTAWQSVRVAAAHAGRIVVTAGVAGGGGALTGFMGNGLRNIAADRNFMDGADDAALYGFAKGAVTGALSGAAVFYGKDAVVGLIQRNAWTRSSIGLTGTIAAGVGAGMTALILTGPAPSAPSGKHNLNQSYRQQPLRFTNLGLA
jgi:RHS repeat-associated protein